MPAARRPGPPRAVERATPDDWLSLVGSVIASLASVWLLYTQILPFSAARSASSSAGTSPSSRCTRASPRCPARADRRRPARGRRSCTARRALVGLALASTVIFTFVKGWPAFHHLNFFTHDMAGVSPTAPLNQGGILHAIVGSLIEIGIAIAVSLPLGHRHRGLS